MKFGRKIHTRQQKTFGSLGLDYKVLLSKIWTNSSIPNTTSVQCCSEVKKSQFWLSDLLHHPSYANSKKTLEAHNHDFFSYTYSILTIKLKSFFVKNSGINYQGFRVHYGFLIKSTDLLDNKNVQLHASYKEGGLSTTRKLISSQIFRCIWEFLTLITFFTHFYTSFTTKKIGVRFSVV